MAIRLAPLTSLLFGALLLAGCGGGADDVATGPTGPTVTASGSASASASRTTVPVDSATPSASPTQRPVVDLSDDDHASFVTPSGNLSCNIFPVSDDARKGWVRCDVQSASWPLPPEPDDCDFDWLRVMTLGTRAEAGACVSDAVDRQGAVTVGYGRSVRWHNIVCDSEQAGLTCTNTDNDRGFTVSRSAYSVR